MTRSAIRGQPPGRIPPFHFNRREAAPRLGLLALASRGVSEKTTTGICVELASFCLETHFAIYLQGSDA
jgi:hypothetical protein